MSEALPVGDQVRFVVTRPSLMLADWLQLMMSAEGVSTPYELLPTVG